MCLIRKRTYVIACALALVLVTGVAGARHDAFRGRAVYYADHYAGDQMACGPLYQPWKMVAAHRTLPCGTRLRVKNRANGRRVTVTVQDRGPFTDGYVLDLSKRAARKLGYLRAGTASVRAVILHD